MLLLSEIFSNNPGIFKIFGTEDIKEKLNASIDNKLLNHYEMEFVTKNYNQIIGLIESNYTLSEIFDALLKQINLSVPLG